MTRNTWPISPPKRNIAIIKATTADLEGNIGFEKEPLYLDALSLAMAAKNSDGFVLVQVEGIADRGALPMRNVIIPGALVDYVAVATNMEHHRQTAGTFFNPAFAHQYKCDNEDATVSMINWLPI